MQAFVHFSVGVSGMLFLLLLVDFDDRREFLLSFASGLWAMVPDLGWLLLRVGLPNTANLWKAVFNSALGLVFWFHPLLDAVDPENKVYEMTSAFVLLAVAVSVYTVKNDWD